MVADSHAVEEVSFRFSKCMSLALNLVFLPLNNSALITFVSLSKVKSFFWIQRLGFRNPELISLCIVRWIALSKLFTKDSSKR